MKRISFALLSFVIFLMLTGLAFTAQTRNCDVCGMMIAEKAKNHIVLKNEDSNKKSLHVCSFGCLRKGQKYDSKYRKIEVSNFNQPDQFLPADKAFFLIKSEKIKPDLGNFVMPPYFGAFKTQKEAVAAKEKYGDGAVVEGIENAMKKS